MLMSLITWDTRQALWRLVLILMPKGRAVTYIEVADIKSSLQEIIALGATIQQDVKDVAKGLLIASVKDKDGNILGFRQNPQY
jgi:predicted enzyme related to lactoylglutathione lyase